MRCLIALLFFFPGATFSQPFLALDLGRASATVADVKQDAGGMAGIAAGYRFGRLSVELAYGDMSGGGVSGSTVRDWETSRLSAAVYVSLPVTPALSVLGGVGANRLDGDLRAYTVGGGVRTDAPLVTWSGWRGSIGVGVEYAFSDDVAVRAMFDYLPAGPDELDKLRTLSIGVARYF
jgi:opacity protein-like surface antigen